MSKRGHTTEPSHAIKEPSFQTQHGKNLGQRVRLCNMTLTISRVYHHKTQPINYKGKQHVPNSVIII